MIRITKMDEQTASIPFEQIFKRLEAILERMNAQDVPLEESLLLFEEANTLLTLGTKRLDDAEKRVEVLVRGRQGELALSNTGLPQTNPIQL
jgi:exodeoxyribonuclease VII small subunit